MPKKSRKTVPRRKMVKRSKERNKRKKSTPIPRKVEKTVGENEIPDSTQEESNSCILQDDYSACSDEDMESAATEMHLAQLEEEILYATGPENTSEFSTEDTAHPETFSLASMEQESAHPSTSTADISSDVEIPPAELLTLALSKFRAILPSDWIPIAGSKGFHLLLLNSGEDKAVQRELFISYSGQFVVKIHCKPLPFANETLRSLSPPGHCTMESLDEFCQSVLFLVKSLMQFKLCVGANHEETKEVWSSTPGTYVDTNPYQELGYTETCRSLSCSKLLPVGSKFLRCGSCSKVMKSLREKSSKVQKEMVSPNTPNMFLTPKQAQERLKIKQDELRKKDRKIRHLETKIDSLLKEEGVDIEEDLSNDFHEILSKANLTPFQKLFLEQQLSAAGKEDPRARRWHPALIRLCLQMRSVSASAFESLRDSGAILLPCSRTLFDYSHSILPKDGVVDDLVKIVANRVSKLNTSYQKYHALLCDEMHVSQNLVYRKADGCLVGYTYLDEVDKELEKFENFLKGDEPVSNPPLASKMLSFMVKGLTSNVKCVVASYPTHQLTKDVLYARSWQVISHLERAGVKVLSYVCDGSSVNRSFFAMHTPITKTKSGIVFDTINFCSPERRPLYFVSDVAHLIKTIRNCLYNSDEEGKKSRCLTINGEKMVWKTIIRLYFTFKGDTLRKSYKLNAQNVFPTSYSCMKVRLAVQILSKTVAIDIQNQNWHGTKELVKFILLCNRFFDCLNGAHSSLHVKKRNEDLAPYCRVDDERFDFLRSFLAYLENWKKEVQNLHLSPKEQEKCMLSRQTLEGIDITVNGFIGATTFLLENEKAKFVNARAFSQDPLEQHFSKSRAGFGGSTNPNVQQVKTKDISTALQGELGMKRRKGNVECEETRFENLNEPLPKRKRTPKK